MAVPAVESLSQHRVTKGELDRIYVNGTGFTGATGVAVGDQWAPDMRVDGDTVITIEIPDVGAGSHWVVVFGPDGSSPCDGPAQTLEIVEPGEEGAGTVDPELKGIEPAEIVVGEKADHWLTGTGLRSVISVIINENHACEFQGHDDEYLRIEVPEDFGVHAGDDVKIQVLNGQGKDSTLTVKTRGRPDDGQAAVINVLHCEPASLPAAGGEFRIVGAGFGANMSVYLGDVLCSDVDVIDDGTLKATAPSLADYVGQTLVATVTSYDSASAGTNATITVTAE